MKEKGPFALRKIFTILIVTFTNSYAALLSYLSNPAVHLYHGLIYYFKIAILSGLLMSDGHRNCEKIVLHEKNIPSKFLENRSHSVFLTKDRKILFHEN